MSSHDTRSFADPEEDAREASAVGTPQLQLLPTATRAPLTVSREDSLRHAETQMLLNDYSQLPVESYRLCRRAHSLRGWSPWHDPVAIPPRSESAPSGWCGSTAPSIRLSGPRSRRSPANWDARPRRCGAGCARPNATPACAPV